MSDKIRHHAQIMLDYRRETYGKGWSTNFYQNHNWINMTGLAAAGYACKGKMKPLHSTFRKPKRTLRGCSR